MSITNKDNKEILFRIIKPMEIIHIDTFQILGQKCVTVIDAFPKYGRAYPLKALMQK